MNKLQTRTYRATVSIAFGLIGFGINFLNVELIEGTTFKISILAGLVFPLVIALVWGWRYGLLSALVGGCQTMWWLWPGDGWGILYSVPVFTFWIIWHGWWAERRSGNYPWYVSSFAVEVPFRIVIELGFLVVFRWLVSMNPPPWNSAISWDQVSSAWLQTVAIKHTVTAYILLMVAYVALSLGPVRRFFGLRPRAAQRDTTTIYAGAGLFGFLLWLVDALVHYFAFPSEGQTFWDIVIHGASAPEVFMRSVYIVGSILAGAVLDRLNRRRVKLQELLDHRNRVLAAIRDVNQLITHEHERDELLRQSCEILISTRGYSTAWAALRNETGKLELTVKSGIGADFSGMRQDMQQEKWPQCYRRAQEQPNGIASIHKPGETCNSCSLSHTYRDTAALAGVLRYGARDYGVLVVALPAGLADDAEEQSLFHELVGDIGFALYTIESREVLAEQEIRFQELADSLPQGVYEIDLDGRFTYVNSQAFEMFGYSQRDLDDGLTAFQLFIPEDRERVSKNIARVMAGENLGGVEYTALRKDHSPVPVAIYSSPILRNGRAVGLRGLVLDIRDQKQAEEIRRKLELQLLQAQKMESVGRLAGGVAHDFNNMLGVIMGNAEIALNRPSLNDQLKADLKEILEAARRSTDITRQLLAFARQQTIDPRKIDLNETVEAMFKMMRRLIGENIDLTWHPGPGRMPVVMDPSQLDQLLANLCVNARDAIGGVGNLTIETGRVRLDKEYCAEHTECVPGEYIMLAVSDNGCGMDKETLNNIFEPFFTTKDVGEGTGLGLATVYGIVKQNNGFINVYSEPGEGTSFIIYLPPCAEEDVGNESEETIEIPASHGETVLLVEDETAILKLGRKILEDLGYTVLVASSPSKAEALAKEYSAQIHLLITDVVMPEMNGRDLANCLKAHFPTLKILFISGYTADIIARQGILESGVNFIQKPFTHRNLAVKVRNVLDCK